MAEYSAQVEAKLKSLSLSPEAARWVMKALDPVRSAPCRIPDAVQVSALVPEYRASVVIGAPAGIGASNWDCCIVLPPSDTIGAMYATNAAGIDFSNTVAATNSVLSNSIPIAGPSGSLAGAQVSTVSGTVSGIGSYRPMYSPELPTMWRTAARSATVYATGSELYNQGTVYAGQYSRKTMPTGGQAMSIGAGNHAVVVTEVVDVPLREQDMAVITPGNTYYTAAAKEGVYSVHRLTGPAQSFVQLEGLTRWRSTDGTLMMFNTSDPTNYTSQTASVARIRTDDFTYLSPNFPPSSALFASTSFDQNCSWGVIIFRGLHPSMSLTLKTITNLEVVPSVNAPSRQFVTPPSRFEPTALSAYYAIASEMPCTMPSKYNFLGAILPAISAVASKVLPFLAPAIAPVLSGLAQRLAGTTQPPQALVAPPNEEARRPVRASSVGSRASRLSRGSTRSKRKVRIAKRKPR